MLPFPTYIDFNFEVQNDANETLTMQGMSNIADGGTTAGFKPYEPTGVTSNGGKGKLSVTN